MKPTITLPEKVKRTIEVEIDPKKWIWVPGTNLFLSEAQHYGDLDWKSQLTTVLQQTPHTVARPDTFTTHYANVCASVRKRNPEKIYDGNHEPLSRSARDDFYERRTTNMWIRLDAYFKEKNNKLLLATDHRLINGVLQPQT